MTESRADQLVNTFTKLGNTLLSHSTSHCSNTCLPNKAVVNSLIPVLIHLLFPRYYYEKVETESSLKLAIPRTISKVYEVLSIEIQRSLEYIGKENGDLEAKAQEKTMAFLKELPSIRQILDKDLEEVLNHDPAAVSKEEVLLAYPGFEALAVYRLAHQLLKLDVPFIPRMLSENVHSRTGIDIHPGAQIGPYCSIDHGTGLIIGETTIIGEHVNLFHNVTLGARSVTPEFRGKKRHPTLGNNIIVYPGATILGDITVGDNSLIGGNVFLLESCPPNSKLYAKPPEVILKSN